MNNYQERPRKGGGTECRYCSACGGTGRLRCDAIIPGLFKDCEKCQWRRLLPIAFTAENAQKVHDGCKTQTRRLLNPQPDIHADWNPQDASGGVSVGGRDWHPRYRVGDVLWVQEPWRTLAYRDCDKPTHLPDERSTVISYEACPADWKLGKLRPGRFLPLRFARPARYEVVAVRCERVNAIGKDDAVAEGICGGSSFPIRDFKALWNSIHDKPGTRFEDAPWVFAYTFKRIR